MPTIILLLIPCQLPADLTLAAIERKPLVLFCGQPSRQVPGCVCAPWDPRGRPRVVIVWQWRDHAGVYGSAWCEVEGWPGVSRLQAVSLPWLH